MPVIRGPSFGMYGRLDSCLCVCVSMPVALEWSGTGVRDKTKDGLWWMGWDDDAELSLWVSLLQLLESGTDFRCQKDPVLRDSYRCPGIRDVYSAPCPKFSLPFDQSQLRRRWRLGRPQINDRTRDERRDDVIEGSSWRRRRVKVSVSSKTEKWKR